MKKIVLVLILVCLIIGIAVIDSCKKEPVIPTLTTSDATNITINSVTTGGSITKDGGAAVSARGVCWSTTPNPDISGSYSTDDSGIGSFISNITGLTPNTPYHVRAYATNKAGTAYGNDIPFNTTPLVVPTLTTSEVTLITLSTAVSGGNIASDGNGAVTARGVCWSTTENPTITDEKTSDGTGIGSFISNLTALLPGTTYHVRAYATNSVGTAYGNDIPFITTTLALPTLTTTVATLMTLTTAVSGGNITSDGGAAVTARGTCWATTANPTISNSKTSDATGIGSFISNLSGLLPGTTYHIRAYATNSVGTAYGNDLTFTTTALAIPTLTTATVTSMTLTTAVSGGNITSDGGAAVTARGVCWATTSNPTISNSKTTDGTGSGSFTSTLTGLQAATIYYVRAYATNSVGTAYGNEVSFTSSQIVVPTLTTNIITGLTYTTAISGGNVLTSGGGTVTGRGVCWATTTLPTISNSLTSDGTGTGSFTSNITGLTPGVTYHVRAYAANSAGTAYGNEVVFTANPIVLPALTTAAITSITLTTAVSGGNVTDAGGGTVSARGVCWSTTTAPTTASSKTTNGTGTGTFISNLTGLLPGTTYYVRAYATNSAGTAYGNELSFPTSPVLVPTVTTTAISSKTQTSVVSGGNATADGGGAVNVRGVCWSATANPTTGDPKTTDGSGTGPFTSNITGLLPGTAYHIRAYATNSAGTAYGSDVPFTTDPIIVPTLTTNAVLTFTTTTAVSGGHITSDGAGSITAKGVCWSLTTNPTTSDSKTTNGTGSADFISNITGLTPGTIYHVRAYATNIAGTAYGNDVPFTTLATALPVLSTTAVTSIEVITAVSGGNITVAGAGTIETRGVCWATTSSPTISDSKTADGIGTGSFTSDLNGLTAGTRYYIRAYATNNAGTGYGNQLIFDTKIADNEGNTYSIVNIGAQVWMKENLATSKYNNGNNIGTTTSLDISTEPTPKYQWAYGDNESNVATYGRLYTFYAVTDVRGVCPTGWHIPSEAEWTILHDYLANYGFAFHPGVDDDIAKSMAATSGWVTDPTAGNVGNNQASNNASGFTGLPGGFRKGNEGIFQELTLNGYWGSSSVGSIPGSTAWWHNLNSSGAYLYKGDFGPWNGYSIRCIKN